MKKSGIIIAIVVGLIVILGIVLISANNNLVSMEAEVDAAMANIDTNLQRRADLIPNLVNTVKGYAAHEQEAIDSVTEARANLTGASTVEEKAEADSALTAALNNLLVIVENYPDLKASANFTQFADELAGTENRIATARRDYNSAVQSYNTAIRKFPTSLIASLFGFTQKEYFQASEGAQTVPNVEF
jgi:LemA protein